MDKITPGCPRRILAAGAACALLLLASACSSDSDGCQSPASPASSSSSSASSSAEASSSSASASARPSDAASQTPSHRATQPAPSPTNQDLGEQSPQPTGSVSAAPEPSQTDAAQGNSSATPGSSEAAGGQAAAQGNGQTGENQAQVCSTDSLRASMTTDQGAAGSVYYKLSFTNTGSNPCSLSGFPRVSMVGSDGKTIGAPATEASELPGAPSRLGPGDSTQAVVRLTQPGLYGDQCQKTSASGFRVTAPGSTGSLTVNLPVSACANSAVKNLSVSQVGATR